MKKIKSSTNCHYCLLAFFALFFSVNIQAQVVEGLEKDKHLFYTPNSKEKGICYAISMTQSTYDTIPEKILASSHFSTYGIVPPTFDTLEEIIQTHPEYTKYEIIPAEYDTTYEEVTIHDQYQYYSLENANDPYPDDCYSIVKEQVHIAQREQKWLIERKDDCRSKEWSDCISLVLSETPDQFHAEEIRIFNCPPRQPKTINVPAQKEMVQRVFLRTPAQVKKIVIPAQYRTIKQAVVRNHASTTLTQIPSEYKLINKLIINAPGGQLITMPVVCEDKLPEVLVKIQQKLKNLDYYKGKTDGKLTDKIKEAMLRYQFDYGLPLGQFDYQTLRKLNIILPEMR